MAKQHGGVREGAGRKKGSGPYGETTKVVRIPESKVAEVKAWLKQQQPLTATEVWQAQNDAAFTLPLYSHKVVAGFPSPADDYIEDRLDLNQKLAPHPNSTFLLRVQGDSMIKAGIFEGDILVVDRSIEPKDGKIVIAALDGELTVKRLSLGKNGMALLPENDDYPVIPIKEESDVVIWGVVTSTIHQF